MIYCNHCIPRVVSWLLRKWRKFNKTFRERFSALTNGQNSSSLSLGFSHSQVLQHSCQLKIVMYESGSTC